jgi:hypothetical protein
MCEVAHTSWKSPDARLDSCARTIRATTYAAIFARFRVVRRNVRCGELPKARGVLLTARGDRHVVTEAVPVPPPRRTSSRLSDLTTIGSDHNLRHGIGTEFQERAAKSAAWSSPVNGCGCHRTGFGCGTSRRTSVAGLSSRGGPHRRVAAVDYRRSTRDISPQPRARA